MSRRRTCCCGCWEWTDDFDRAAIGDNWHRASGSWSLQHRAGVDASEKQLVESGSSGAEIVCKKTPHADPIGILAGVTLIPPSGQSPYYVVGTKYRLIVGYPAVWDGEAMTEYLTVQLEIIESAPGIGGLLSVKPGSDPWVGNFEVPIVGSLEVPEELTVCIDGPMWRAKNSGATYHVFGEIKDLAPYAASWPAYVGLGNGADKEVIYDDFTLQEHYSDNPICPGCVCNCQGHSIPEYVLVTLVNKLACTKADGFQMLMRNMQECLWQSEEVGDVGRGCQVTPGWYPLGGTISPEMLMIEDEPERFDPLTSIRLRPNGNARVKTQSAPYFNAWIYPVEANCNPLYLKFGPFCWGEGELEGAYGGCEGLQNCTPYDGEPSEWWLVVTEQPQA